MSDLDNLIGPVDDQPEGTPQSRVVKYNVLVVAEKMCSATATHPLRCKCHDRPTLESLYAGDLGSIMPTVIFEDDEEWTSPDA